MKPKDAVAYVELHGIVLESGNGPVPNLAEAIAGQRIRGSWWGHPKGRSIFAATRAVRESSDVLACKLLGGKVTYIHRRLWPAVVRLAAKFDKDSLAAIREDYPYLTAEDLEFAPRYARAYPRVGRPRESAKAPSR